MADYGNWVSRRLVYLPGGLGILFCVIASMLLARGGVWTARVGGVLLLVLGVLLLVCMVYFAIARSWFSPQGRDLQSRIRGEVLDKLTWEGGGEALDIGCGNGALAIEVAKRYRKMYVTGVDYWGRSWEYSVGVCVRNSRIEGVEDRMTFRRANAASLPFDDESFDVVVSNLVFHEVAGVTDKRELLKEALRVVKKGGRFVWQDLFLWEQVYGDTSDLIATIKSWGVAQVELEVTRDRDYLPKALRLPFMTGTMAIIYGTK